MKSLIKTRTFIGAFLLAYFLFFAFTILILDLKSDGIGIGHLEYGFPFTYYYSHCFGGYYIWSGLAGNILFAAVFGLSVGLAASHLRLKFSSPEFRAKWHL